MSIIERRAYLDFKDVSSLHSFEVYKRFYPFTAEKGSLGPVFFGAHAVSFCFETDADLHSIVTRSGFKIASEPEVVNDLYLDRWPAEYAKIELL